MKVSPSNKWWSIPFLVLANISSGFLVFLPVAHSFLPSIPYNNKNNNNKAAVRVLSTTFSLAAKQRRDNKNNDTDSSFLLQEFKTHTGEIIDPYQILKVSRTADRFAIKRSYRDLSRRYHPDGVRHKDILPGSCNNLEDVREHWERIKLSYEILSDRKRRTRYDRHTAIADPGAALQRAAVNAAWNGAVEVGKGLFRVGAFAVQQVAKAGTAAKQENNYQVQHRNEVPSSSSSSSAGTPRVVPETEAN